MLCRVMSHTFLVDVTVQLTERNTREGQRAQMTYIFITMVTCMRRSGSWLIMTAMEILQVMSLL